MYNKLISEFAIMSSQHNDFQLLQQYYNEIKTHDVSKNYNNFQKKTIISITHIENIIVTKYYSKTNAFSYPSYLVDCGNGHILDVAKAIFSSSATTFLDPIRKVCQTIYVGQAQNPADVGKRFANHMQADNPAMPKDLYNKISLNTNAAMFAPIAFTFHNFKMRDVTDLFFLENTVIQNVDPKKIVNKSYITNSRY